MKETLQQKIERFISGKHRDFTSKSMQLLTAKEKNEFAECLRLQVELQCITDEIEMLKDLHNHY